MQGRGGEGRTVKHADEEREEQQGEELAAVSLRPVGHARVKEQQYNEDRDQDGLGSPEAICAPSQGQLCLLDRHETKTYPDCPAAVYAACCKTVAHDPNLGQVHDMQTAPSVCFGGGKRDQGWCAIDLESTANWHGMMSWEDIHRKMLRFTRSTSLSMHAFSMFQPLSANLDRISARSCICRLVSLKPPLPLMTACL